MNGIFWFAMLWPFGQSSLLLWGLAAALPILIHLWFRRQAVPERWAAMEFLLAALQRHARRLRFEQFVLLALRVSILLVLAIALANPWLPTGESSLATVDRPLAHTVIVLDASYSMTVRQGASTLFEQARDAAIARIRASRQGDSFSFVLLADPPQAIISEPVFDHSTLIGELQNVQPTHGGADLRATLTDLVTIVERASRNARRATHHQVHFYSDLGKTSWTNASNNEVLRLATQLTERATIELTEVGQATDNSALVNLVLQESLALAPSELTAVAEVQGFGSAETLHRRIEFRLDGRALGQQSVDVPPRGRATVTMRFRCDTTGDHLLSAVLRDDALQLDNQRWLAFPTRSRATALCIEGRPGDAEHLAFALQPQRTDSPQVQVEVAGENALLERPLAPFDLVALSNVARFTTEESQILRAYVRSGGLLLIFPGDLSQIENYNSELATEQHGERLIPGQLEAPTAIASYRLDPRRYEDPLIAPFRGQERAGLLSTPIWKYVPLQIDPKSSPVVALWFDNEAPAIVRQAAGRGECIWFATAATPAALDRTAAPPTPWTALPTWPSFVPLIQECLKASTAHRIATHNIVVGQPWELSADAFTSRSTTIDPASNPNSNALPGESISVPTSVMVTMPAATDETPEVQRVSATGGGRAATFVFADTLHCGAYTANAEPDQFPPKFLAVNLDTRESDLERVDLASLPEVWRKTTATLPTAPRSTSDNKLSHIPLFREFLGLLLGLLLSESALAWWFGRGRG